MGKMIEALFDGTALYPAETLTIEPNTRVWIVVEPMPLAFAAPKSFLQTARSLELDGPSDWSVNLEKYLYGDGDRNEE